MSDFYDLHDKKTAQAYKAYAELAGVYAKRWTDADLCYAIGVHREGFLARLGEAGDDVKAAAEWQQIAKVPSFDDLQARRSDPFRERCSRKSCNGRCSQCVRASAIERNRTRYGSNGDYPGADAASAILRVRGAA